MFVDRIELHAMKIKCDRNEFFYMYELHHSFKHVYVLLD